MKKHQIILSAVLLVLALGVLTPQFAQEASTAAEQSDQQSRNHALFLGLLRTINTAEVVDSSTYGSYESWQTLLAHQPDLNGWLATNYSREPNVHFGDLPEILPGWNLRLNVHADGQGYDVLLEDASDKTGYAALSDERGVIRECKWLQ
jgi:hypothetical protein